MLLALRFAPFRERSNPKMNPRKQRCRALESSWAKPFVGIGGSETNGGADDRAWRGKSSGVSGTEAVEQLFKRCMRRNPCG